MEAPFPKSYNFQLLAQRDTLWALHPEGTWFSTDGVQWAKSPLTNALHNNAFLKYVPFRDRLYALGQFDGNSERFSFSTIVRSSTDLRTWQTVAAQSGLPQRFFAYPFVFRDRIWQLGGWDGTRDRADLWSSDDAVHWQQEVDSLPFAAARAQQVVYLRDTLYALSDAVWASTDALHWWEVTARIVPDEIFGYTPVVWKDRIWLIGCSRNGTFQSEVLVSSNGRDWSAQEAPWSPRGGVAACVFNGGIVITGGKYGGQQGGTTEFVYSNDVWMLK